MHFLATPKGVMAKLKNYTHFYSQESQQESVQMAPKYPGRRLLKIAFFSRRTPRYCACLVTATWQLPKGGAGAVLSQLPVRLMAGPLD
jgi:hypothetical protein